MLVLTRHNNQQITIKTPNGDEIIIHTFIIRSNNVKIGIEAPADYLILREEIIEID